MAAISSTSKLVQALLLSAWPHTKPKQKAGSSSVLDPSTLADKSSTFLFTVLAFDLQRASLFSASVFVSACQTSRPFNPFALLYRV